jgi:hypothetical protein
MNSHLIWNNFVNEHKSREFCFIYETTHKIGLYSILNIGKEL